MAGVSPGVMAPDCENGMSLGVITPNCENGVSLAVMTPEEGARPGSQLVGVVWSSQNELSRSPPSISSFEVGRGEPPLFHSGCPAGIMKELENVMPLGKIASVFNGEPAGMTLLLYAKRG